MDGQTHVSATTRSDSHTTRSSGGISYPDMRDLFRLSGMLDISTTFSPTLYSVTIRPWLPISRLQALNTPWDRPSWSQRRRPRPANPLNGRDASRRRRIRSPSSSRTAGPCWREPTRRSTTWRPAAPQPARSSAAGTLAALARAAERDQAAAETFSVGKDSVPSSPESWRTWRSWGQTVRRPAAGHQEGADVKA